MMIAEHTAKSESRRIIRVVVAKPGLDGHDRGARVIARALRDAGMEVVYTGLHQTPEDIVSTCVQEDADVCALSILSGAHMALVPRVVQLLKERGAADIIVMAGGIIPEDDVPQLLDAGVASVMGPGTPTDSIVEAIQSLVGERDKAASGG
jgi:methylmalonyl-CoA mutase C-terminal domain/subunit